MVSILRRSRNGGQLGATFFGPGGEPGVIKLPNVPSSLLNLSPSFQLGPQKGCEQVGWQETATQIHPSILLHLSAQKAQPIRPLFPNDFRSCYVVAVVE